MPEAPINEYSHSLFGKDEVRLTKEWITTSPAYQTASSEKINGAKLRRSITAALNPSHDLGPLSPVENVRHRDLASEIRQSRIIGAALFENLEKLPPSALRFFEKGRPLES